MTMPMGQVKSPANNRQRIEKILSEIHNQISSLQVKTEILSYGKLIDNIESEPISGDNFIEREMHIILKRLVELQSNIG
jgi:hypothetical protein